MKWMLSTAMILSLLVCAACKTTGTGGASGEASPEILTKEEVRVLMVGKTYTMEGPRWTETVTVKTDGSIFAESGYGSSGGSWEIKDNGKFCYNWSDLSWTGGCGYIKRTSTPNKYTQSTGVRQYKLTF